MHLLIAESTVVAILVAVDDGVEVASPIALDDCVDLLDGRSIGPGLADRVAGREAAATDREYRAGERAPSLMRMFFKWNQMGNALARFRMAIICDRNGITLTIVARRWPSSYFRYWYTVSRAMP